MRAFVDTGSSADQDHETAMSPVTGQIKEIVAIAGHQDPSVSDGMLKDTLIARIGRHDLSNKNHRVSRL